MRLNLEQFIDAIKDLTIIYPRINKEQLKIYHRKFENEDYFTIKKAVDFILDNHQGKGFPDVKEFYQAIDFVKDSMKWTSGPIHQCNYCDGTGYVLITKQIENHHGEMVDHEFARPCDHCRLGRKIKQGWDQREKNLKRYRREQGV